MIVWLNGTHGAGRTTSPLVVESARRVLDHTGGTLVVPMTVLVEQYWREISAGLAQHAIPVRHFVLHADQETLRGRIARDTTHLTPAQAALRIAESVTA
ncbi:hypothetical protein [Streptomyces hokutonensis]|uniref:hypothetical protein n=1 Tax=Streptomyces hokutonensis TaxID=1306990 RepID=UPI00037BBB01|nr:hypothetical protein [Streptomyces hokutonensis]